MTEDKSNHIKMEIIQCFRDEQERIRDENRNLFAEQKIILEKLKKFDQVEESQIVLISKVAGLERDKENLDKRLSKHSNEAKENYKELKDFFTAMKDEFSSFKGDVLRKLDNMAGRDSVLKIIFGAFAGGFIAYLVSKMFA
jgi:hypothetical protein